MTDPAPEPLEPGPAPFLRQDCALTLREAIAAHRARIPNPVLGDEDPTVAAMFAGHDACHAVFGCSNDPIDEGRADTWTIFGSTMSVRRYVAYLSHPALAPIFKELLTWRLVLPALLSLIDIPRIWVRARAMREPWDFDAWERWLDVPLRDIRRTFGIRVLRA